MIKTILIITGIIILVAIIIEIFTSKPIPKEHLNCYIGGLGAGKTYLAVNKAVSWYKTEYRKYIISIIKHPFRKKKRLKKPYIYSNIPIKLGIYKMSEVLKTEHIYMTELLPEHTAIVFDEIGQACDQFKFDLPQVKKNVQTFVRFYRHFINGGGIFCTEQNTDFIAKPIRGRFNRVIELRKLHRWLFIFPFGKVYWNSLTMTNDIVNTKDVTSITYNKYFFFMPYNKRYESRVYSEAYVKGFTHTAPDKWDRKNMKTRYIIDVTIPCDRNIYGTATLMGESSERGERSPLSELRKGLTIQAINGKMESIANITK